MTVAVKTIDSPVGAMQLTVDDDALTGALFVEADEAPEPDGGPSDNWLLDEAARQCGAYFAGALEEFDLPLAPRGTVFQQRVWAQLRQIPFGSTASYGEIARRLGMPPGASRAVGLANGSNPIAIIVPCHRVIGANGTLTGYAGGLERKRYLLDLEARDLLFTG